jgi:hypothetical protein
MRQRVSRKGGPLAKSLPASRDRGLGIVVRGFHGNATPASSAILVVGVLSIGSLIVRIIVKLDHLIGRLVGLEEIGDFLAGFNQDLHEIRGNIGVSVIVEGGCKAFVANACSTS